jgi:membrane glycosyltransferase
MDRVAESSRLDRGAARSSPPLPAGAPLDMAEQSLSATDKRTSPSTGPRTIGLRRALVFGSTIALTAAAAQQMYLVVTVNGLTLLQGVVLALYVALFAWIALSFVSALIGFFIVASGYREQLGIEEAAEPPKLSTRCALLFPTFNETPARLVARVHAIYESVEQSGEIEQFDIFILSDTNDPNIWLEEEKQFLALQGRTGYGRVFYRHRYRNEGRKAGNIAEWIRRYGAQYGAMVVLDADSLMTGDTLVRLVGALERNPQVAIIQTLPKIIHATTLFARVQQFANSLYGPLIAHGVAWWHGAEGNYWGHNAVIRVSAFAAAAGLPVLPGRKPFGGAIMSHDFVEAALLRRRGWAIHMAPSLSGSYEETPPTLADYATRDRRWCQGNLQHIRILPAKGLHWVSRLHLLMGIGSYVTAPMWLAFLLLGVLISLQAQFITPDYFPPGFTLFPQWPTEDPVRAAWVFAGTMALLLAPKLLAVLASCTSRSARGQYRHIPQTFLSVVLEVLISGLIAPVMMWKQSVAVLQVLLGKDSGWSAQARDDVAMPFRALLRRYAGATMVGILLASAALAVSLPLLLWMSPVIVGLLLAVPLAGITSARSVGQALRRWGLLLAAEEQAPPTILRRAGELASAYETKSSGGFEIWQELVDDPALWGAHHEMLPERKPSKPDDIDVDLVVGLARLDQCRDLQQAFGLLSRAEKNALLADAQGLDRLRSLAARRHPRAA